MIMTQDERNPIMGALVNRYNDNQELLVCIKEKIPFIQNNLVMLSRALGSPQHVKLIGDGWVLFETDKGETLKVYSQEVTDLLSDYHKAILGK